MYRFLFSFVGATCLLSTSALARELSSTEVTRAEFMELVNNGLNCRQAPEKNASIIFAFQKGDRMYPNWSSGSGLFAWTAINGESWAEVTYRSWESDSGYQSCWLRAKTEYLRPVYREGLIALCETSAHRVRVSRVNAGQGQNYTYQAWQRPYQTGARPGMTITRYVDDNNPFPRATKTNIFRFWNGNYGYSLEIHTGESHTSATFSVGTGKNDELEKVLREDACITVTE